jgi:hypothetical protein
VKRLLITLLPAAGCAVGSAHADGSDAQRRAGDVLRLAMPIGTLAIELARGERDGALQYSESLAVAVVATEVLKRATQVERPDRSNDQSFPSGHATWAFSAATYAHRRYGIENAWPLYALATYVGYTRVQSRRHRWGDVAGGAALSGAASWWLVEPKSRVSISVVPDFDSRAVALHVSTAW